jgi:uncharacterized protein (TIGR03435 family)
MTLAKGNLQIAAAVATLAVVELFPLAAQQEGAGTTFEVASIRAHQGSSFRSGPLTVSGPLIRLEGYTVFGLVMDAYHLRDFQLAFGSVAPPDGIYDAMYDVVARSPGDKVPNLDEVRLMLQSLLADRFKLRVHRESKEMPVYALQVAKNGGKLKAASVEGQCSVQTRLASDGRNNEDTFSACPVERLADRLGNLMHERPVLDQTGLTGNYDFRLLLTPEYRSRNQSNPADISAVTAVGELGLKLAPEKAQVEILVVDHLEKPTAN